MTGQELAEVEILRVNGTRERHQVGRHILLDWCKRMIGAELFDTVNLRDGRVMLVDDLGYAKNLPANAQATEIYHGLCNTTWQIVGDTAICWDEDFA